MSRADFVGFQCDYSDKGTFSLTLDVAPPGRKRKPDDDLATRSITLLVPLWLPLRRGDDGEDKVVEGEHFVNCAKRGAGFEFFISKDDFDRRMPRSSDSAFQDVYRQDWAEAALSDGLACVAYDDTGLLLGSVSKGVRGWPRGGLIAPLPRLGTADEKVKARMEIQANIWRDIAITTTSAGSSRLWKPASWNERPLQIWLLPCRNSSWPTLAALKKIVDKLRDEEKEKANNAASRRLALLDWLKWDVPGSAFNSADYVLLSTNLLRMYDTFISVKDLQRLVAAQTEGNADWRRPWPTEDKAKTVHDEMLENLKKTNQTAYYDLMNGGLKKRTTAKISSSKTFGKRIDANKIMGSKSANQLGKSWWMVGDVPKVVAEWLHRSAYSLGPLTSADFQSPDNIVFGTFEANSDMTRAEAAIRTLRDVTGAEGVLTTTVVAANVQDSSRLTCIDSGTGVVQPWNIDEWITKKNYTWIAPKLLYSGSMTLSVSPAISVPWSTQFHPFSRYSPLILEGKLDSRLLAAYLKDHNLLPSGSSSDSSKRSKPGPSSSSYSLASATSDRKLLVAMPTPTTPPSASSRRSYRMAQFVPHPQKDLGAISAHAFSVKHSGVFVTHPRTHTAWRSIIQNASHVTLGDVRLENPRLAQNGNDIGEPTDAPPSTGFMLEGNIKLFGIEKYDVALQSWHGPPPPGIDVGSDIPVYQRVQLQDACLCDLVPLLEGTPFADIEFTNITITYQNYQFVQNMLPGWTITTELGVGEKSAELYRILHDVLGYSDANVQLQASVYLGLGHSWTGRPQVPSFVVTGVLDVASQINEVRQDTTQPGGVQLCAGVTLSRVGVSIYGVSIPTFGLNSTEHTQYGFKVFGDMHVGVPGSVTPLDLDFEMTEFSGAVDLFATVKGGLWKNAFGTGIDLDMVQLSASFPISSIKELACSVRAHFQAESASALITGSFTIGGGYSLSAYVEDLGCEGIVDLFRHYTGEELSLPSHVDVTIGSASIAIEKGAGLYIEVDRLAFDSYEANSAVVQLSSKGVRVRATAENLKLPGDIGISLVDGYMEVSFETQGSGRSTDVALGGKVQLNGFSSIPSIQAGVHLYKSSSTPALEWTVYGSFTDLGNTTTLGNLFPGLKKSFLQDFALQDLMFVAASSDDPALSHFNPLKYPIKKGVQFSALLAEVDPFNKLLRRTSFPGLILSACWNAGDSFVLDVVLPTDTLIHLGRGIVTDPITLSIDTERLLLRVATGVQIPVPESDTPLDFKASLTIQGESVKLEGEMHGLWKDPFGVSKGVSIGPFLELGLAIDLVEFPETGIPTSFSFAGGLAIGETEGQVAVQISEIPSRELLYGEMKKFGIKDLVAFARDLTQLPIPTVPNFVAFEDVKVYVSTGVTLSDITYPAGFSFDASLYVFGARFHASAEISGGVLAVSGNVDELVVGPLRVTGQRGVKPSVDLHVGMTAQELRVDGAMELLGAHVGLALHLEILPDPTFSFSFQLNFTDLLVFLVDAQMLGKIEDLNDVSGVNFVLHALFEQHVVEYVEKHVLETLEALKKSTDEKIQDAEAKVQTEEKKLQDGIDVAQANLTKAYDSWVQHAEQVHKTSQTFIDNYMNQLRTLENNVEEKRKSFNTDLKSAEGALEHANAARAAKMQSAEAAVTNAKSKWDSDVADAEKKLDETNRYMQEKFGSAEEDIAEAKRKVDSLQSEIDETNSRIHYCEDSPWYRFDLKAELVWQGTKLLALEGSKATADGVLWLAEKVVEGTAYLEAKAAIPAAKKVVEDVGEAGDLAFKGAQATLREVNTLTAAAIRDATHVLETVRKDGDALIRSAEFALQKFVNGNKALLTAAQHAVDGLIHSAEWIAYQAATSGLDLAKHATHALDIAKGALEAARKVADGAIVVTEEVVEAAMSTLNITRIELGTTLDVLLGSGGYHFEADVSGTIIEGPFALHLKLDMKNTAQLILDISHELLKIGK